MEITLTDYKSLELSLKENIFFYTLSASAAVFTGWLFYDSPFAGAVWLLLTVFVKPRYASNLNRKRKNKLTLQFKDMLYSVSAFVLSGRSLGQAMEASVDFWKGTYGEKDFIIKEIRAMSKRMKEGGERDVELLKDFAMRSGIEDINDFAVACDTCKKTGGDFAKAVSRCADIIGDKLSLEKELNVIASQKRFEGRIVGMAPFAIILFIKLLAPEYLYPLSHTQQGRAVSTIALMAIVIGWLMIERMNDIEF